MQDYIELDKITLARWVDKALDQTLTKKILYQGSKVQGFDHLTLGPWMKKLVDISELNQGKKRR